MLVAFCIMVGNGAGTVSAPRGGCLVDEALIHISEYDSTSYDSDEVYSFSLSDLPSTSYYSDDDSESSSSDSSSDEMDLVSGCFEANEYACLKAGGDFFEDDTSCDAKKKKREAPASEGSSEAPAQHKGSKRHMPAGKRALPAFTQRRVPGKRSAAAKKQAAHKKSVAAAAAAAPAVDAAAAAPAARPVEQNAAAFAALHVE